MKFYKSVQIDLTELTQNKSLKINILQVNLTYLINIDKFLKFFLELFRFFMTLIKCLHNLYKNFFVLFYFYFINTRTTKDTNLSFHQIF